MMKYRPAEGESAGAWLQACAASHATSDETPLLCTEPSLALATNTLTHLQGPGEGQLELRIASGQLRPLHQACHTGCLQKAHAHLQ